MTRFIIFTKIVGGLFIISFALSVAGVFFLEHYAENRYEKLIADRELLETFVSSKEKSARDEAVGRLGVEYQAFRGTEVTYSSTERLPAPRLIDVSTYIGQGVLLEETSASLSRLKPYIVLVGYRPFLAFALRPIITDGSEEGYIIYQSIL